MLSNGCWTYVPIRNISQITSARISSAALSDNDNDMSRVIILSRPTTDRN